MFGTGDTFQIHWLITENPSPNTSAFRSNTVLHNKKLEIKCTYCIYLFVFSPLILISDEGPMNVVNVQQILFMYLQWVQGYIWSWYLEPWNFWITSHETDDSTVDHLVVLSVDYGSQTVAMIKKKK